MDTKVMIKAPKKNNNLLEALISYMEHESIAYVVVEDIKEMDRDITNIIDIEENESQLDELPINKEISIILIGNEKRVVKGNKAIINYIVTDLVDDDSKYTKVQKEYLFKNGIYQVLLQKVGELLDNVNQYNGIIYDLTEIKKKPDNWTFKFDSINETYKWLSSKNKDLKENFTQKVINFYNDKIYNDSLNEINYLSDKLLNIKMKKHIIDIFVCTNEELEKYQNNYFFKVLLKNISDTYHIYLAKKEDILKNDPEIYEKLLDGIIIYDDCVYRDTYKDEISLGIVDCKQETIQEYDKYFNYVLEKYGHKLNSECDINEF